mmetsp:Transcript_31629/g.69168  ORF Transcript_31629/g.69168 Transcript_31629/m.69168 type:complete len:207 (-) Transcript_31629:14-634(-)
MSFLNVGQMIPRTRVPWALQNLLRENLLVAIESCVDLLLGHARFDDFVLPLDALAVFSLVLRLDILVLRHQVDKLSSQCSMHVCSDARLARALVQPSKVLVLGVHRFERTAHLLCQLVRLLHQLVQTLCCFPPLLGGDGGEALAVGLLDHTYVVADRPHRLLHLLDLLKKGAHKSGGVGRAARFHIKTDGAGAELTQPIVHRAPSR